MSVPLPGNERLLDLLAARATEGLPGPEDLEMRRLLAGHSGVTADTLEPAAAALDLAIDAARGLTEEDLPPELRERILLSADDHLPQQRVRRRAGVAGWLVAAAVLLVFLLLLLLTALEG